jgi:hypothetical protein
MCRIAGPMIPICTPGQRMLPTYEWPSSRMSDLEDLMGTYGQTMLPKAPMDASSHINPESKGTKLRGQDFGWECRESRTEALTERG